MSTSIDTALLVDEVKKRPIFYDRKHSRYRDRGEMKKAWQEVAQIVVRNWEDMNATARATAEKCLRNKWRHMRDYFIKELKDKRGSKGIRRTRRSAYFRDMRFLLPLIEPNKRLTFISPTAVQLKTEEFICEPSGSSDNNEDTVESSRSFHHDDRNPIDIAESHPLDPLSQSTLGTIDNDISDMNPSHDGQNFMPVEEDYDKMFLLSLLPSLRQVPENMRLQVRIDMQQVLATALRASNNQ